jgi:PAS domain S-box-containing protein
MNPKRASRSEIDSKRLPDSVSEPWAASVAAQSRIHRQRYREFFEFAPDCQLLTDVRGIILDANQAAAKLLDCRKEFLLEKPLGLFLLAGCRMRFYDCLRRLHSTGADVFETRIGRRGEARDVLMRVDTLEEGAGRLVCRWLVRDTTEQHQIEDARRDLTKRLATVQEEERRRIARELHDEMGQHLTALILDLKLLGDAFPPDDPARKQLDNVRRSAGQIGQLVHRLATELRPAALDDLGLAVTLRNHMADWSRRTGVRADFRELGPAWMRPPADIEITIYRVAQEALTNVAKHANATRVSVILHRRENSVGVIIEDNGRGFDAESIWKSAAQAGRLGLLGMKERVTMLGGSLVIESAFHGPTSIYVEVPTTSSESEAARG